MRFWLTYILFILTPRKTNARYRLSKKLANLACTFRQCSMILAPLTPSKSLAYRHTEVFRKALDLTENYEQALCLCNWARNQKERELAYSRMVIHTDFDASSHRVNELIHDYGIRLGVKKVTVKALNRLHLYFKDSPEIGDSGANFIKDLKFYGSPEDNFSY